MKTSLSHILPVWRACQILGEPKVRRIVQTLMQLRTRGVAVHANVTLTDGSERDPNATNTTQEELWDEELEQLVEALFYMPNQPSHGATRGVGGGVGSIARRTSSNSNAPVTVPTPPVIAQSWQKLTSHSRMFGMDKTLLFRFIVPNVCQPHSGPQGHMGLFDCWVYTLQGHAPTSSATYYGGAANSLVWIPDILIFLAICKDYEEHFYNLPMTNSTSPEEEEDNNNNNNNNNNNDKKEEQAKKAQPSDQPKEDGEGKVADKDDDEEEEDEFEEEEDGEDEEDEEEEDSEEDSEEDEDESTDEEAIEEEKRQKKRRMCLQTMAKLAYRFYDSYQKKGTLARDTLHRFLTDVYGEDSYKTMAMRQLLDIIFKPEKKTISATAAAAGNSGVAAGAPTQLSEAQFVQRILMTTPTTEAQKVVQKQHATHGSSGHVLLDWISLLGTAMVPLEELPPSTVAYLDTMQVHPQPIVHQYLLAETRLYEIKRRFHSLVESSALIIQGDPMAANGEEAGGGSSKMDGGGGGGVTPTKVDAGTKVASTSTSTPAPTVPKHVITQSAFITAVARPNSDMGQGGYLPSRLARLIFGTILKGGSATAVMMDTTDDDEDDNPFGAKDGVAKAKKSYWGLYHVLKFGCEAVRLTKEVKVHKGRSKKVKPQDRDLPLLKQLFAMFTQAASASRTTTKGDKPKKQPKDPLDGRLVLDRHQIGTMLLLLLEHAHFRLQQDAPPQKIDEDNTTVHEDDPLDASEDTYVNASACALLGLLPPTDQPPAPTEQVSVKDLVDFVLAQAKTNKDDGPGTISFEEFCRWHYSSNNSGGNAANDDKFASTTQTRRLGPLLLELRLIAAVLFGIPPALASMEVMLIAELQRRHKYRYPPTEVSRRGPKGTVWYIVDHAWFQNWASLVKRVSHTVDDAGDGRSDATSTTSRSLPKINNTNLLAENGSLALRADIRWGHDYEILPPLAWSALQAWYDGGPPIHRTVVPYIPSNLTSPHSRKQPKIRTEMEMELYPFFVTVFMCDATSRGDARPFQQYVPVSRVSPVRVVLLQLAKGLNVDPDMCRLWVMGSDQDSTDEAADTDWLLDLDKNIVEQRNHRKQTHPGSASSGGENGGITLLLELRDDDSNRWPRGLDGRRRSYLDNRGQQGSDEPEMGDGVVGLYNMGNTCYLNSSIQCLSHTPIFREYFTSKAYINDINTTNPLGHQGHLATVSAQLIVSLWKRIGNQMGSVASSSYNSRQPRRVTAPGSYCPVNAPSLTPKTFKESLGKFNDIFQGNEQHDAQELLAFLLDGLSEDLNRIVDKPYIEAPDSDGQRPDSELADIWWSNHLKREMSIIVALFTGQYKSLLTCRSCKYESARFEPFMFLQLPLPEDDHVPVVVVFYPLCKLDEKGKPGPQSDLFKYSVRVRNDGNLFDVQVALAKLLHAEQVNKDAEELGELGDNTETQHELQRLTSTCSEDIQALDAIYLKRAKNMAVVDMRDGYISKVASNSWSLHDLQNKETGELPLLHVYELDPLPEDNLLSFNASMRGELGRDDDEIKPIKATSNNDEEEVEDEDGSDGDDDTSHASEEQVPASQPAKFSFLALAQRKSEVMSRDFLHPLSHRVFGTPMLLRIENLEAFTGRDLYDTVAVRLRNFVPKSALRFLELDEEEAEVYEQKKQQQQAEEPRRNVDGRQRLKKTTTDMEEVSSGPVPRYGFRLRITSRDGRRCTLCPWFECCIGCLVPDDDFPTIVMCGDSIAVDWHFAVDVATSGFGQRINSQIDPLVASSGFSQRRNIPPVTIKNHSSMGAGPKKAGIPGAIMLEDCLDSFAKEEKIPEAYCSKCKDFRVQTKRMSLWRLPPIVIIHLKRFQFTQHMRRKLRDLVVFPVEGLDLSRIVASDNSTPPEVGAKPKKQKKKGKGKKGKSSKANGESPRPSSKRTLSDDPNPYLEDFDNSGDDMTAATECTNPLTSDDGRSEMLYDLYGVVHHQGALSGGHYVASLKSELDGQWRLFNDAQIYEIHSRDVIDSSAYILFYIRRDVKDARLSDYWDTTAREGQGLTAEEVESLLQGQGGHGASERCVIS